MRKHCSFDMHNGTCTHIFNSFFICYFTKVWLKIHYDQLMNDPQNSPGFHNRGLLFCMTFFTSTNISSYHIKKTLAQNISWFDSPTSAPIFKHRLTSSEPTFSRGLGFGRLYYVRILYFLPPILYLLPNNLRLTVTSTWHDSFHWIYF